MVASADYERKSGRVVRNGGKREGESLQASFLNTLVRSQTRPHAEKPFSLSKGSFSFTKNNALNFRKFNVLNPIAQTSTETP